MKQHKQTLQNYLKGRLNQAEELTMHEKGLASTGTIHIPFYESLAIRLSHDQYTKLVAVTSVLKEALTTG